MSSQTPNGSVPPRHFSMIRSFCLADFFTLANGGCGTAGIFFAMAHVRQESPGKVYPTTPGAGPMEWRQFPRVTRSA